MRKTRKSVLAILLASIFIFPNNIIIGNCQINSNTKNSNVLTIQPDPEDIKHRSMGEYSNQGSAQNNKAYISNSKTIKSTDYMGTGTATTNDLNVRSGPGVSHEIVNTINKGDNVNVVSKSGNWYEITLDDDNDSTGYVSASYIKLYAVEKGIDVSHHDGTINWDKVKASGIDYVIIRAGYGTNTVDSKFYSNIKGASKAGLKIGIYWFSYATTKSKAVTEAKKCLSTIKPYKDYINYPVFYDFEYASVDYARNLGVSITQSKASSMANAFLDTISDAGYKTGLYTNKDFGDRYFYKDILTDNNLWVAQYSSTCTYPRAYMMWQCSETGRVNGISTYVDVNYTYLDPSKLD